MMRYDIKTPIDLICKKKELLCATLVRVKDDGMCIEARMGLTFQCPVPWKMELAAAAQLV